MPENKKIVIQKLISGSGIYSRRKAEELIRAGMVFVNGQIAKLGDRADDKDEVEVCGKKINSQPEKKYIILNKPVGYTCTRRFFGGEKNVYELVKDRSLVVAGRLDKDSHGLVLMTNDGNLVEKITHPRYEHEKKYIAKVDKAVHFDVASIFKKGVMIKEGMAKAKEVKKTGVFLYEIILTEGKKRQIREMFKKIGLEVVDLKRISIGKLELGDLKDGQSKEIKYKLLD